MDAVAYPKEGQFRIEPQGHDPVRAYQNFLDGMERLYFRLTDGTNALPDDVTLTVYVFAGNVDATNEYADERDLGRKLVRVVRDHV